MAEPAAWSILLGLLGLILGSFIATVVVRWPQGESVLAGRSRCDACGRTLGPLDLVPVLSFVVLHGRCRGCGSAIGPGHLVIELVAGCIGAAAGWVAPGSEGAIGAGFGWLLLTLGALDLAALWLPDLLTGALALAGLSVGLSGFGPELADGLIGGLAGFAALWAIAWGYRRFRGREGLGGGDPKLFGAIGLWLGWQALPFVLLAASALGLGVVLAMAALGRKPEMADRLPLGTMLAAAAWFVWLAAR